MSISYFTGTSGRQLPISPISGWSWDLHAAGPLEQELNFVVLTPGTEQRQGFSSFWVHTSWSKNRKAMQDTAWKYSRDIMIRSNQDYGNARARMIDDLYQTRIKTCALQCNEFQWMLAIRALTSIWMCLYLFFYDNLQIIQSVGGGLFACQPDSLTQERENFWGVRESGTRE